MEEQEPTIIGSREDVEKFLRLDLKVFNTRTCNLAALNSATKYPSIQTYHKIGERGRLLPELTMQLSGMLFATEKCDGTNARIILPPDGKFIIGSRETLLFASGDLIHNPDLGIVDAVREIADNLRQRTPVTDQGLIGVVYGEVYGKGVNGWKNYTNTGKVGFRVFDVATVPVSILDNPVEKIAHWRDGGGQEYASRNSIDAYCALTGLIPVPSVAMVDASELPTDIRQTYEWLEKVCPETSLSLDGCKGQPEGVVVRDSNRKQIVKIRFEDYERSLR